MITPADILGGYSPRQMALMRSWQVKDRAVLADICKRNSRRMSGPPVYNIKKPTALRAGNSIRIGDMT